jgi:hypothetical protein
MSAELSAHEGPSNGIPTELAFGFDDKIYVNTQDVPAENYADRILFDGYALTSGELRALGRHGLLAYVLRGVVAKGSDGLVYVEAKLLERGTLQGRARFKGFAMTAEETTVAWEEIHRTAFNVTAGVQMTLRKRRRRHASRRRTSRTPTRRRHERASKSP